MANTAVPYASTPKQDWTIQIVCMLKKDNACCFHFVRFLSLVPPIFQRSNPPFLKKKNKMFTFFYFLLSYLSYWCPPDWTATFFENIRHYLTITDIIRQYEAFFDNIQLFLKINIIRRNSTFLDRWIMSAFLDFSFFFQRIKGVGGVQAKNFNFFYFDICYSPNFLLSQMGSYFTQLSLLLILCPFTWRGYCQI